MAVPLENAYPIRFINTNLNSLLECIFVLKKYEQEIDNATDDDIETILDEIKKKFESIDKEVFNDEENWWSVILEHFADGRNNR